MPWCRKFKSWLSSGSLPAGSFRADLSQPSLLPAALTWVSAQRSGTLLAVTADSSQADALISAVAPLRSLQADSRALLQIPEVSSNRRLWYPENESSRCAALALASSEQPAVFIASAAVLLDRTLSRPDFQRRSLVLRRGMQISPAALAEQLVALDYDCEYEVSRPGEFARRGGIFDLYSPLYEAPVRMEFWGDEIDSMHFFSPSTQRSGAAVTELRVIPRGAAVIQEQPEQSSRVWEYFSDQVVLVLCDEEGINAHLQEFAGPEALTDWQQCRRHFRQRIHLDCSRLEVAGEASEREELPAVTVPVVALDELLANPLPELSGEAGLWHWQQLRDSLLRWHAAGYQLVACCSGQGEGERLRELLQEDKQTKALPLSIEPLELSVGLLFPQEQLVLLSDKEIFGRQPVQRRYKHLDYQYENAVLDSADLEPGVLAVHVNHGICRYLGLKLVQSGSESCEVIELEFADEVRLQVPLEQSHLVSRYVGGSKNTPALSSLNGSLWKRRKEEAGSAAWDLAAELLRLEALRQSAQGAQFKAMPEWERSFASSFPYRETPDQTAAIEAVLADMADSKPMDRLLCGDVGYGKTEVALRAAFRAVMNGRQVAVLVPTTVLAQQHFQTFRARMAEFPVRIELLSRYRSQKAQKQTLAELRCGKVDIVIGTHRLLQRDVHFANLGLLVIDEEQRFGVMHKQRLKSMRASVDILTMTATPIPRTLYLSLSGIRNLSTINTAPADRMPVNTIVAHFESELIRQAIRRELERQGQVFFLYNRVQSIGKIRDFLVELVPEARIAVAHGQMPSAELEEIMTDFVAGQSDVLLCTTIIESGIDIPNVNTIIIDRADRFGLSELYQLRGRVGRYHRQAYCYLLLPPMGMLPENARQRLAAIRRYTHLGAGFRLALKDLEIRGAGNLLGAEQSGHIAAVGFDLYCQLLQQAVAKMEQREHVGIQPIPVDFDKLVPSLTPVPGKTQIGIPLEYISEESVRMDCYQRLSKLLEPQDVDRYAEELADRFGPLPAMTALLLAVQKVVILARQRQLLRLNVKSGRLIMETSSGLVKRNRQVPVLSATDGAGQVAETLAFLQSMRRTSTAPAGNAAAYR